MSRTRSEMIGMMLCKFPMVRNTSYYGVQVIHYVRRSHRYQKSSKTTKYALRAVACVSTLFELWSGGRFTCSLWLCLFPTWGPQSLVLEGGHLVPASRAFSHPTPSSLSLEHAHCNLRARLGPPPDNGTFLNFFFFEDLPSVFWRRDSPPWCPPPLLTHIPHCSQAFYSQCQVCVIT